MKPHLPCSPAACKNNNKTKKKRREKGAFFTLFPTQNPLHYPSITNNQNPNSKPSIFCLIWAIIVIYTFVEDFIYKERNPFGNRERKKSRTIVKTVIVNKVVESFFLFLFFVIFLFSYVFFPLMISMLMSLVTATIYLSYPNHITLCFHFALCFVFLYCCCHHS